MEMGRYRFDEAAAVGIIEKIVLIALILVVTWALAKAATWAFAKLVDNVSFFRRHTTSSGESVGRSIGRIVSLLIWLFGLIAILRVLDLAEVMAPLQTLLNDIAGFIPNLIGAALIFFIGLIIARIVRDLVVTALQTVDFDRWLNRGGADTVTDRNHTISRTIGTIIYAIIVIIVAIAALNVLDIDVISDPATRMLELILASIPRIIGAAILLAIGYLVSRFVVQIIKEVLPGLGFDRSLQETGVVGETTSASSIIARVVQVAIILFFAIAATRLLGFPELTVLLGEILELGGQVIFGAVVIGVGFLIANLLARIIAGEDGESLPAGIVKWATIVLFVFMGLTFMGVGEEIVQLAFAALVIGGAVAAALAFGLGGREWAGRKLEELDQAARDGKLDAGGKLPSRPARTATTTRTTTVKPVRTVTADDVPPTPPGDPIPPKA